MTSSASSLLLQFSVADETFSSIASRTGELERLILFAVGVGYDVKADDLVIDLCLSVYRDGIDHGGDKCGDKYCKNCFFHNMTPFPRY